MRRRLSYSIAIVGALALTVGIALLSRHLHARTDTFGTRAAGVAIVALGVAALAGFF